MGRIEPNYTLEVAHDIYMVLLDSTSVLDIAPINDARFHLKPTEVCAYESDRHNVRLPATDRLRPIPFRVERTHVFANLDALLREVKLPPHPLSDAALLNARLHEGNIALQLLSRVSWNAP